MGFMNIKKMILYVSKFFIPSGTAAYIIVTNSFNWGTYLFWGYSMNIPAYIISCIIAAIIYYPLDQYVFKSKCEEIPIDINGRKIMIRPYDKIDVYADPWGDYDISLERENER
jgi:hypothetical protein